VTIDGISLTIARLADDVIEVAVIPHTYRETNLADRRPGERVNLECDVLAKHIERLLSSVELPGR
jgi:riboflavin synthase